MKTYVITVARTFPASHKRKGEPTRFIESIIELVKLHTIRKNYDYWKPRIDNVASGNAVLSLRVWTGRPYHSTPKEVLQLNATHGVGIAKIQRTTTDGWLINDELTDLTTETIAKNDGLSLEEFEGWFKKATDPMAIIYFRHLRYACYNFDFSKIENMVFDYDTREAPRFENAYLESGDYGDRELTDDEVDWINENEPGFVHESLIDYLS